MWKKVEEKSKPWNMMHNISLTDFCHTDRVKIFDKWRQKMHKKEKKKWLSTQVVPDYRRRLNLEFMLSYNTLLSIPSIIPFL